MYSDNWFGSAVLIAFIIIIFVFLPIRADSGGSRTSKLCLDPLRRQNPLFVKLMMSAGHTLTLIRSKRETRTSVRTFTCAVCSPQVRSASLSPSRFLTTTNPRTSIKPSASCWRPATPGPWSCSPLTKTSGTQHSLSTHGSGHTRSEPVLIKYDLLFFQQIYLR